LKSYLKILRIPYFFEDSNIPITSDSIKHIIRLTHIFNNIILASCLYIIIVSLKLDIAIIWMDIWDFQSGFNTKILINRYFNIRSHITTIHSTNMNTEVSQCKNYWKWEHTTFACQINNVKYPKCNGPYNLEHHKDIAWCCKPNFKINHWDWKL